MTIDRNKLLTNQQEKELALRIQNGDKNALEQLVGANLNFVAHLAKNYVGQGVDFDDLVSEGNVGLVKAASNYDPSCEHRFATYAAPAIRKAIEKAISQQAGLYKVPQDALSEAEIKRSKAVSVDAPIPAGSQNNYNLLHIVENKNAKQADDNLLLLDSAEKLSEIIDALDDREKQVISLIYGIGTDHHTMAETGAIMDLKRERVRQIRDKALRKLRKRKNALMSL